MTEIKNRHLSEQGEIDRAKIEGYSLRSGAFYSWLKESGYTTSQIATRLDMEEQELFGREQLRVLIRLMGASSACFVMYFPTFEFRKQIYFEVFGKELPLQEKRQRRWKKN